MGYIFLYLIFRLVDQNQEVENIGRLLGFRLNSNAHPSLGSRSITSFILFLSGESRPNSRQMDQNEGYYERRQRLVMRGEWINGKEIKDACNLLPYISMFLWRIWISWWVAECWLNQVLRELRQ